MQARNERRKTDLPINLCDLAKVDSLEKLIVYQLLIHAEEVTELKLERRCSLIRRSLIYANSAKYLIKPPFI